MRTKMPLVLATALLLGAGVHAAVPSKDNAPAKAAAPAPNTGRVQSVTQSAGRIASQPARDVGVARTKFPQPLIDASQDPYSLKGLKTCKQIAAAHFALSDVLGPDLHPGETKKENRAGKIAEAGGQTVVNSLIPFRGLVREVTGAAPAQRRLNRMIDAGYARRGFLRGVLIARGCKTKLV